ncbi:hypothetical protein P154DRAFT_300144 [Amniculicola lignicola CBS 123094]|uniref:Benzoylformate decarboxylase n=1 Tax=Amniculicola lignicola CBS 123094 TaxID=1392246 RepID=A0A6A5W796_9PLEO|nr:hypothetical protein P154DRAFT_300144 [Amniculicola lignicola CBS 123094]
MAFRNVQIPYNVSTPPKADDFTPLEEHQTQTPATFFDGKPVLYAHYAGLTLAIEETRLSASPAIKQFASSTEDGHALVKNVEIWVTSKDLFLSQTAPSPVAVAIPYPAIALHATGKFKSQFESLFMNISLNDAADVNDEEDIDILDLTVLPPNYASPDSDSACIKEIYTAMNACADLHPDPDADEDDGDVDFEDDTAPGASGWITAENVDQYYLDDEGTIQNRGEIDMDIGQELGPGAGTVRPREDEGPPVNGAGGANGDTKWQRTD